MSKVMITEQYLTDIADAIREKLETQDEYKPSEMAEAILSISGGVQFAKIRLLGSVINDSLIGLNGNTYGQNFVAAPLDNNLAMFNPFIGAESWKVHLKVKTSQTVNHPQTLFGSSGNYFTMPTIDFNTGSMWFGYSTNGSSWTHNISIVISDFSVDTWYIFEIGWDGENFWAAIYDENDALIETQSVAVSTPCYANSGQTFRFGGVNNSGNNVASHIWYDMLDTYIEVNDVIIWGNKE